MGQHSQRRFEASTSIMTKRLMPGSVAVVIFLATLCIACARPAADLNKSSDQPTKTVCDVLRSAPFYNRKIVAVRGIYWNGLSQTCPDSIVTRYGLPNALNLSTSALVRSDEAVSFETDEASWDQLDELVLREARAGHREEIWVTVVGQFRTMDFHDGIPTGGFGHLGAFPAELVVERVYDIKIEPAPTYDYGEILRVHAQ